MRITYHIDCVCVYVSIALVSIKYEMNEKKWIERLETNILYNSSFRTCSLKIYIKSPDDKRNQHQQIITFYIVY